MTRASIIGLVALGCLAAGTVFESGQLRAAILFSDGFENGLSQWVGRTGTTAGHSAKTVLDPIRTGNDVVSFTQVTAGGDIWSMDQKLALVSGQRYVLSFEYLGYAAPGSVADNFGGFVGITDRVGGESSSRIWLYSTQAGFTSNGVTARHLVDDGHWGTYSYEFVWNRSSGPFQRFTNNSVRLVFQDFKTTDNRGIPRDACFDNVVVKSIPEPASLLVWSALGALAVAAGFWRRAR